ncbi:MAG: hypothetical protein AAFR61_00915 [Bacteroidota bacterium]
MMRNTLFTALFCIILMGSLSAQYSTRCARDFTLLKASVETVADDLKEGQILYLSQVYLQRLESGHFRRENSGMKHFDYVRPASRKEAKTQTVDQTKVEKVLADGNVYGLKVTPPDVHFFAAKKGFQGKFLPSWDDPYMVVPVGLSPIDIRKFRDAPFRIKEKDPDFLLMEAAGIEVIFYTGYPETSSVFDAGMVVDQLVEKRSMAESLIGKRFLVQKHPSLRVRETPQGKTQAPEVKLDEFEIKVRRVLVSHHEVLLGFGEKNLSWLVLDKEAEFPLFDLECLDKEVAFRLTYRSEEDEAKSSELNKLLQTGKSLEELTAETWVKEMMQGRFVKNRRLAREGQWFEYAWLPRGDLAASFLTVLVNPAGKTRLVSRYAAEKGLFHTKVEVFINGETYKSTRVSTLDKKHHLRDRHGELFIETLHYPVGNDVDLIEAIARHADQPITVRFMAGGSFFQDLSLDQAYKESIRDAWLYANLLQK